MTRDIHSITAPRVGRPRREEAGDVDARILAAATELFLNQGVAATSCEAVAARARVGKASLYARYSGKDALFEAVVEKAVGSTAFLPEIEDLSKDSVRNMLAIAGKASLLHALSPVPLELMRLLLTEARRCPALISHLNSLARGKVVDIITRTIGEVHGIDGAPKSLQAIVERFLDLSFAPLILAALSGNVAGASEDAVSNQIKFALDTLESEGHLEDMDALPYKRQYHADDLGG